VCGGGGGVVMLFFVMHIQKVIENGYSMTQIWGRNAQEKMVRDFRSGRTREGLGGTRGPQEPRFWPKMGSVHHYSIPTPDVCLT